MKLSLLGRCLGLGLLVGVFVWSALHALRPRSGATLADGRKVIRFAHWQLEGGLRETFDHLAKDYERLNPGVRVEQVAVPERIFSQWLNTQLVGGTITDLVALDPGKGTTDELVARYFTPLSEHVELPNPYNTGTPLEGVPLRETILDGLQGNVCYFANLLEYYGVPLSMFTVRMYYNRTLWRSVLGDTPPPEDFDAFLALCERVRAHNQRTGDNLIPVAGSRDNAAPLTDRLFSSQTQRVNQRIDIFRDLRPTTQAVGLALLRGDWTVDEPALVRGFELVREAGLNFQPGYRQIDRADAAFYFVQGRALMIATGSWDSASFGRQASFEMGVFNIPIPAPSHPRYGPQVLGPASENDVGASLSFGIPRSSPNFEQALDFLRYLVSQGANAEFSRRSGWLPSVVGVEPPPAIAAFKPRDTGYVDGFVVSAIGADTQLLLQAQMGLLISRVGSVDAYLDAIRPNLSSAVRSDLRRDRRNALNNIARQDVIFASLEAARDPTTAGLDEKASALLEAQNRREALTAWQNHEVNRLQTNR
jgi:raffinose/stachyose/melibiose transport system substrate-binding protein